VAPLGGDAYAGQIVPPKGAPNILLIMTDDQGYGITSTFGGVIPTPTMDRIAQMGLRYTEFHSRPSAACAKACFFACERETVVTKAPTDICL
jgi:hypothetical protein